MLGRRASTFVTLFALNATIASGFSAGQSKAVVTLVERANVDGPRLLLGLIGRIDASDPAMVSALNDVLVGLSPAPGQSRLLDRAEVESALSLAGFAPWDVELAGASGVMLARTAQLIPTAKLNRALRRAFSRELGVPDQELSFHDLILGDVPRVGGGATEIEAELLGEPALDVRTRARLLVVVGGVPAARIEAEVTASRVAVAAARMRTSGASRARRERLVRRGQHVVVQLDGPSLRITTSGRAKASGARGEEIAVENTDSGIVMRAIVESEGLVRVPWSHISGVPAARRQ